MWLQESGHLPRLLPRAYGVGVGVASHQCTTSRGNHELEKSAMPSREVAVSGDSVSPRSTLSRNEVSAGVGVSPASRWCRAPSACPHRRAESRREARRNVGEVARVPQLPSTESAPVRASAV